MKEDFQVSEWRVEYIIDMKNENLAMRKFEKESFECSDSYSVKQHNGKATSSAGTSLGGTISRGSPVKAAPARVDVNTYQVASSSRTAPTISIVKLQTHPRQVAFGFSHHKEA